MKLTVLFLLLAAPWFSYARHIDSLNTAKNCTYMTAEEREMIYEINIMRSNPKGYLIYIAPMLVEAEKTLKEDGKGIANYALTFTGGSTNGKDYEKVDTTWYYSNEENVKALQSLVNDLKNLSPLSVLQPDKGIYLAAKKHATDQHKHNWELMHTGSDGSQPWDRIKKFSPRMSFGNENIAARSGFPSVRDIVIQLLVDGGIPGYGHRYNMLDPQWTHVACTAENFKGGTMPMYWWIQEFGVINNQ